MRTVFVVAKMTAELIEKWHQVVIEGGGQICNVENAASSDAETKDYRDVWNIYTSKTFCQG